MNMHIAPFAAILPTLFSVGCSTLQAPFDRVGETVIESLIPATASEAWRLDITRQPSRLGGSVLCGSSIEHVVRLEDPVWSIATEATVEGENRDELSVTPDPQAVERAWRKYCHHQLDLTAAEREWIEKTPLPPTDPTRHCDPRSLKK